jgi:IS30 family transposase
LSPGQWRQVQAQLRAGLSPEQISGRRARCQPQDWQVSVQAIYNACVRYGWGRWLPWVRLRAHLRRPARKPYAGRAKPIDKRSRWANGRRQRGHYEADTMCGKRSDAKRVLVVVERTTLLTCLRLVPAANAQATASSVQRAVQQAHMPCGLRSVTTDRGVEFARLGDALPTKAYVCDAHRPNQRATNENQIGVLRRYLPKGQSLDNLSGSKLYRLQHKLNHTPRKCLGFLTPYEVAFQRPPHVAVRT